MVGVEHDLGVGHFGHRHRQNLTLRRLHLQLCARIKRDFRRNVRARHGLTGVRIRLAIGHVGGHLYRLLVTHDHAGDRGIEAGDDLA